MNTKRDQANAAPIKFTIIEQNDELLQCVAIGSAYKDLGDYDAILAESTVYGGPAAHTYQVQDDAVAASAATIRRITAVDPRSGERVTLLKVRIDRSTVMRGDRRLEEAIDAKRLSLFLGLKYTLATSRGTFTEICKTRAEFDKLIHTLKTGKYTRSTPGGVRHGTYDCVEITPVFAIG